MPSDATSSGTSAVTSAECSAPIADVSAISARYFRFTFNDTHDGGHLQLEEFQTWAGATQLFPTLSSSPSPNLGSDAELYDDTVVGQRVLWTSGNLPVVFTCDFAQPEAITEIQQYSWAANSGADNVDVEYSDNGADWTSLPSVNLPAGLGYNGKVEIQ